MLLFSKQSIMCHVFNTLILYCLVALPIAFATEASVKPLTISFNQLQPDWWTDWDYLDQDQKQNFIDNIQNLYIQFLEEAPQDLAWTSIKPDVDNALDSIQANLALTDDVKQVQLPDKSNIDILEWSETFEQIRKLETNATAQAKETENFFQAVNISLETLRSTVISYRNADDIIDKNQLGAKLFLLQLSHILELEKLNLSKSKLEKLQQNIHTTKTSLDSLLSKITYRETVRLTLQNLRQTLDDKLSKLELEQKQIELKRQDSNLTKSKTAQLSLDLNFLKNRSEILQSKIQIDEVTILADINFVLDNPSINIDTQWATIIEAKENEAEKIKEQADFIRLQLLSASYEEERSKKIQNLWQEFESIQRVYFDIEKRFENANHYRKVLGKVYVKERGWLALISSRWSQWWEDFDVSWYDIINYPIVTINESPITLFNLVNIIVIVVFAIFISLSIRRALSRLVVKYEVSESTTFTVGRILHYMIVSTAIIFALASLGLDFSKIALVAGALSVGIGFGLQSIFNNFVSGLILLFERPLKVGDIVELESGVKGHIRAINVRSTRVTTRDNIDILVPNAEFVNGRVTNYTFADPMRRIHIPFKVPIGSDKEQVREAGLTAAGRVRYSGNSKGKKPDVWLVEFGDSWLTFAVVVWVNSHRSPNDNYLFALYNWEIESALNEFGIKIPIPEQNIFLQRKHDRLVGEGQESDST